MLLSLFLSWASGALSNHAIVCTETKLKRPQDRKTAFETLLLPVAKILSPVARQAPTKRLEERSWIFSPETATAFLNFSDMRRVAISGDFFETFRGFGVLGSVDGRGDPGSLALRVVIFLFPCNPPHPNRTPRPSHPRQLDFSTFRVRFALEGGNRASVIGF